MPFLRLLCRHRLLRLRPSVSVLMRRTSRISQPLASTFRTWAAAPGSTATRRETAHPLEATGDADGVSVGVASDLWDQFTWSSCRSILAKKTYSEPASNLVRDTGIEIGAVSPAFVVSPRPLNVLRWFDFTACISAYGRRNEFRRNPPLCRGDGEEMPFSGHTLEPVSAAVLELEP